MAREDLPPPLPPETRTVGQLVAESVRFYQDHFWRVLPLGLALALVNQVTLNQSVVVQVLVLGAAAPLITAAYVAASALVTGGQPTRSAFATGILIWLPVPVLMVFYVLPALAWLAFFGLAVPAAVAKGLSWRQALERGRALGRVDFVHALGAITALTLVFGLTRTVLIFLLQNQADAALRAAIVLGDLVISPLLYVGSALLYHDQAARLDSRGGQRRIDADVHPVVEPDGAGSPDPEVEPRAAARGEP